MYTKTRTRLKMPDAIDLHRFFAPECDLSFGNCATADVENIRVVAKTRENKNIVGRPRKGKEALRDNEQSQQAVGGVNKEDRDASGVCNAGVCLLHPDRERQRDRVHTSFPSTTMSTTPQEDADRVRTHNERCQKEILNIRDRSV